MMFVPFTGTIRQTDIYVSIRGRTKPVWRTWEAIRTFQ